MAANVEFVSVQLFDCKGNITSLSPGWNSWKKSFRFFVERKGVRNVKQKKALLLHCIINIWNASYSIETREGIDECEAALKVLDEHFSPKANIPHERHVFCQMKQENSESVDQFVIRLTHQAENCNFGSQRTEQLCDQIMDKCRSSGLRRKLLERGKIQNWKMSNEFPVLWKEQKCKRGRWKSQKIE